MTKEKKVDKNPMAINILKLQRYNFKYFQLEEVVFFEYIIIKAQALGFKPFFHSSATIADETGIKRTRLDRIIHRFVNDGYIHVEVRGMPKVKHFEVDFNVIRSHLHKIYRVAETDLPFAEFSKLLDDFFKLFVDKYQQKNINKNNKEETLKETIVTDNGLAESEQEFYSLVKQISESYELQPFQASYDKQRAQAILSQFGPDLIRGTLIGYFEEEGQEGTISGYIKSMEDNYRESLEIETELAKRLLDKLSQIFNERRKRADNGKKYSSTSLAVNNSAIEKAKQALKHKPEEAIRHAFTAYADAIINEEERPKRILNYFFTVKDGDYPIIDNYLDVFNTEYSH